VYVDETDKLRSLGWTFAPLHLVQQLGVLLCIASVGIECLMT
jgi:hypothetical protein